MSLPVLLSILWVFAATLTALLPMRNQYLPGITLLIAAPILILWLGAAHGWGWSALALAAFLSMFRNPLRHIWARARGHGAERP
ncbi:DUF2484 family protein [Salibaculum sp.]|jgi:hypothetical protein|uniref:DUF2484 family protein n=1 Tax=Salibaculum sp. TaxID=2855480 RepID=UPI002B47B3FC|nr:DUF2484 family protein [Salibaculum sp.]HKL69238.1 DUF2484 family protein [Salibaculum sp.]